MQYGIVIFATDTTIAIDELAGAAEQRNFESLWVPEHTHIPVSRRSPWPGGAELPDEYRRTHDPFVSLMAAAGATSRLRIGTGVCLVIERDTITTAKAVASLDTLSGGRFLLGVGAGWNAEEMAHHSTAFDTRFKKMCEQIAAMKKIWTKDEAEFHGHIVDFDPIWCWPKPLQQPHPPVYLGGTGRHTLRRVVDHCDGWMPIGRDPDQLIQLVPELQRVADEAGRDMQSINLTVFGCPPDRTVIDRYAQAGFERIIFSLPSVDRDTVMAKLDSYAELI